MIAVIADDFTGAAEIGGIGLRRGLKTVIETGLVQQEDADLLIIATDTRSLSAADAIIKTEKVTRHLMKLSPEFIYKKLDSVLRGNIADELKAQMNVSGKYRAVVVAGNPYLGRTIKEGIYYINGTPVADTFFARDPEFPVNTSLIREIIGIHRPDVFSLSSDHPVPDRGLIFGDVPDKKDMEKWARKIDENTIPAGGAEFFDTLIGFHFPRKHKHTTPKCTLGKRVLFVFGSAYPKETAKYQLIKQKGVVFMQLPLPLYVKNTPDKEMTDGWADNVLQQIDDKGKVIVYISQIEGFNSAFSKNIRECMGQVVQRIFENRQLDDLLIEGGATTSEILRHLGITKLYPFRELESGVIQMKTEKYPGLRITTKPGSYPWPDCLIMYEEKSFDNKQTFTNPA